MSLLSLTILLLAVGLILIILEILLPTHAILGALGILCLLGSVGVCYRHNPTASVVLLLALAISTPFAWSLAVKIWPKTYFGKRILLPPAQSASSHLEFQIGQTGAALTHLRPMGECLFNGKKIPARAEAGLIPAGAPVQIISADGRTPLVRQLPQ